MIRALWLAPYNPWPPDQGGKIRVWEVLRRLAGHNIEAEVWYAARHDDDPPPPVAGIEFHPYPVRDRRSVAGKLLSLASASATSPWELSPRGLTRVLRARAHRFDVLVLDQAFHAPVALGLASDLPVVVITQNIEHVTTRALARGITRRRTRVLHRVDGLKLRRDEQRLFRAAALVTAVSEADAAGVRSLAPRATVRLSPNGVDLAANSFRRNAEGTNRLVLTGTLSYPPNADAARRIHQVLLPAIRREMPDVEMDLVGSAGTAEVAKLHDPQQGFHVVGRVDDVVPYLHRADVFLMPLSIGGGTRLKSLQAMACGTPVVSTALGISGIGARPGVHVEVADDDAGLVELTLRLLRDPDRRLALAKEARAFVEERYGWDQIVSSLAQDIRSAAGDTAQR